MIAFEVNYHMMTDYSTIKKLLNLKLHPTLVITCNNFEQTVNECAFKF